MPVEFVRQNVCENEKCASTRLTLDYDGSGRRISKTVWRKAAGESDWLKDNVTHYTGIGTEVRENFAGSTPSAKVVVTLPEGLGRYAPGDASKNADAHALKDENGNELAGMLPGTNFEWFLKNHLGSTMLVYGTQSNASPDVTNKGLLKAAYDYHATVVAMRTKQQVAKCCPPFGEQLTLAEPADKVTETFTGKELDDETELSNHGARMLDPMLGMWISVDPKRFFPSPYLYMGNGYNPINFSDLNGMAPGNPFNTPTEAAQDFARLYNGVSIATSTEYGTAIYRRGNSFYYTEPIMGDRNGVTIPVPNLENDAQLITSAHTHGSYEGYKNLEPSLMDYVSDFSFKNEFAVNKEYLYDPAYVVVPDGSLIEYGIDVNNFDLPFQKLRPSQDIVPTEGIPSDPASANAALETQYHPF